jgi:DNA-binding response OmpR family regulator
MPKKNGREALAEIKQDEKLKTLPILVFSTSKADEDVVTTYKLGANSYINKPDSYEGLVAILKTVRRYWHETVEVPR